MYKGRLNALMMLGTHRTKRTSVHKVISRNIQSEIIMAIHPIQEYCSDVWGHNLSKKQSSQLESIPKRAIRIIYRATRLMPYDSLLYSSNITSLEDRRSQQAKKFFTSILDQSSCLHHLLPQQRDNVVTFRLRSAFKFPVPFTRTNFNHL